MFNFLKRFFGSKKISHVPVTQEFLEWEKNISDVRNLIIKMGNRSIVESRTKLFIRYFSKTGLSPFMEDSKLESLKRVLAEQGIILGNPRV